MFLKTNFNPLRFPKKCVNRNFGIPFLGTFKLKNSKLYYHLTK